MNLKCRRLLVGLSLLLLMAGAHAQSIVRGKTVKADGSPLSGVSVQAFRRGEVSQVVPSGPDGSYSIDLPKGSPITRIEYRHTGFDLACIELVSGSEPQNIVKVMFAKGEPRSVAATLDTISAYQQFSLAALNSQPQERTRFMAVARELDLPQKLSILPRPTDAQNDGVVQFLDQQRKSAITLLEGVR